MFVVSVSVGSSALLHKIFGPLFCFVEAVVKDKSGACCKSVLSAKGPPILEGGSK